MNCQRTRELFSELLDTRTGPRAIAPGAPAATDDIETARGHLASCPECQREYAALAQTLAALDALPVPPPSPRLRRDFYAMLEEEKHSAASVRAAAQSERRRARRVFWSWLLAPVACALFAGAGFALGLRHADPATAPATAPAVATDQTSRELQELRRKVDRLEALNQLVATSFLEQQRRPAADRLRDVLTSAAQEKPSDTVIDELIASLALDPSVNVRLRALEALYPQADREVVRAGVLASLPRESDPLVQVAMIDFLAAARDHEAKSTLESMSLNERADQSVRTAAKRALAQL